MAKITWNPILNMSDEVFTEMPVPQSVPSGPLDFSMFSEAPVTAPEMRNLVDPSQAYPISVQELVEPATEVLDQNTNYNWTQPPLKGPTKWIKATDNAKATFAGYTEPPEPGLKGLILFAENSTANAISPTGARSRMQVLPSTARQPGYGLKGLTPEEFEDTHIVEQFGNQYLGVVNKEMGGDTGWTAFAYNQGIGKAKEIQAALKAGKRPKIPLEGQKYVAKLQPYLDKDYSYLYPDVVQQKLAQTYRQSSRR